MPYLWYSAVMNVPSPDVLEALAAAPSLTETGNDFSITLPHECFVEAQTEHLNNQKIARIKYIGVPGNLQNHGLGGRLIKSLFRHCADTSVDIVRGYIAAPEALHVRRRVLGEQALHFIEVVGGEEVELPMTFGQACDIYQRLGDQYDMHAHLGTEQDEAADGTLQVDVYMSEIDCSSWEAPVVSAAPQPAMRIDSSEIIRSCNDYLDRLAAQAPCSTFLATRRPARRRRTRR